jgi:cytochrome oxidase Cu insertion factor (SCO1/SenC/PrrC family)
MSPKAKLGLVFLACAAPFVLGWAAYYFGWGVTGSAGNYGELIAPRPVAGPLAPLKGKWVLVTFDPAACDPACEKKLYVVRQVRKAQGKEADRIERLWVVTDGGKPRPELLAATDGERVTAEPLDFKGDDIYLVDPLGNLMMRFPRDPEPSKMIKDLQRLLKYSRFG